jgi:hypothetical protein
LKEKQCVLGAGQKVAWLTSLFEGISEQEDSLLSYYVPSKPVPVNIPFSDREAHVLVMVSSRTQDVQDHVLVVGEDYISPVIELNNDVTAALGIAKLKVNNTVDSHL